MSKPSWDDAPEWAQWMAQDENGEWYWYEREPVEQRESWSAMGGRARSADPGRHIWTDTKEARP